MKKILVLIVVSLCAWPLWAAPDISGVSGSISHGENITIAGSGFGTKSVAAPTIWDNCSGTDITTLWSGGWPDASEAAYNLSYRTPAQVGRDIPLPHSHITKYMCGAHYPGSGANSGYNVMPFKAFTVSSYPMYVYGSAYIRSDDNWTFCSSGGGDNNYKDFDFSNGNTPYTMSSATNNNWYAAHFVGPKNASETVQWIVNDDGPMTTLQNPDNSGHSAIYWGSASNPFAGSWIKIEFELCVYDETGSTGYFKLWENGSLDINYVGRTDNWTGTTKNVSFGGYARCNYATNWRYFADLYVDYTRQRVLIGNANTLAGCTTLREVQIPSAWSDSEITVSVNQGGFADGATAYLYVFDATGAANSSGYEITFGDEGEPAPAPPTLSNVTISGGSFR